METVTMIVDALASGAVAGLEPAAEEAVKSGYNNLKALIQKRFSKVDIKPLEEKPGSKTKQDALAEDLTDVGADKDDEVLHAAQELIRLIESKAPASAAAIGIDIERLRAGGSINIEDVVSEGTGVKVGDMEAQQDVTIKNVRAGQGRSADPNG